MIQANRQLSIDIQFSGSVISQAILVSAPVTRWSLFQTLQEIL